MAELSQTLDTRIILKNGALADWNSSTLKLMEGEVALAKVSVPQPDGTVAPTFVAKIGLEGKTFSECPMLFAPASDVYAWAKLENPTVDQLPANIKTAIKDLQAAIGSGGSVAEAIAAAINALDGTTEGDGNFVKAVTQTDGKITVTKGKIEIEDVEGLPERLTGIDNRIDAIDNTTTGSVKVLTDRIAAEETTRAQAVTGLDGRVSTIETSLATGGNTAKAIKAAQDAADEAQRQVDALETVVANNETDIEQKYTDEKTAREQADADLSGRIGDIEAVIGGVTGAMHFKGVVTTDPTKITTGYAAGDVVVYNNKEYVFNTTDNGATANGFVELGDVTDVDRRLTDVENNKVDKTTYNQKVSEIEEQLAEKALGSDLTELTNRVTEAEGDIDDLDAAINTPTTGLAAKVAANEKAINDEKTERQQAIITLTGTVNSKADQKDLDTVSGKVTTAEGKISTLEGKVSTAEGTIQQHTKDIADEKAAREQTDVRVGAIETLLTGTLILNCGGPAGPATT